MVRAFICQIAPDPSSDGSRLRYQGRCCRRCQTFSPSPSSSLLSLQMDHQHNILHCYWANGDFLPNRCAWLSNLWWIQIVTISWMVTDLHGSRIVPQYNFRYCIPELQFHNPSSPPRPCHPARVWLSSRISGHLAWHYSQWLDHSLKVWDWWCLSFWSWEGNYKTPMRGQFYN